MLLLVSNMDDSNRDGKKYANSHLLCFLDAKTFKCLPNNIVAHQFLDFYLFAAYTFYRNMGNMDDRLPV